ncbi:MAG: hypothetical protein ACTH9T_04860 [Mycetocola reblochoni]|uniref:hypothetical protein n=1 Tax=Mycetocola reblochoni TaxID=331618 RepID=UPI003F9DC5CD
MTKLTAIQPNTAPFFENSPELSRGGSPEFSLYLWNRIRDRGAEPRHHSGYADDDAQRLEFLEGARLYGLELVDLDDPAELERLRSMHPPRHPLQPQQLKMADTLNRSFDSYAVEIPRRASKTTTIFCWLLGRLKCRPAYQVTFSAQNGVAGSRRLREWANKLDAITPPDDADLPPWLQGKPRRSRAAERHTALFGIDPVQKQHATGGRGFRIMRGEVGKGIYFDNGSQLLVLKPDADAYRGEAADVSWIDEAQEIDPDEGADLMAGIVPLQDTKPGSAIVISGTAGEERRGPFWEELHRLRETDPDVGGIDYAADPLTPWDDIEDENRAMAILAEVHPGVGTLTTIDKMRKNWRKLPRPQWAREYLSLWPEGYGLTAIRSDLWDAARTETKKRRPSRVAFGWDTRPGGKSSAVCAAWRDSRGVAHVELVAHRLGTSWLPKLGADLSANYTGSTLAYDDIAEGKATALEMQRLRPRPRVRIISYRDMASGCVQFMRDLEAGNLRHYDQPGLDDAAAHATKREVRGDQGVWLWSSDGAGDVSPLVAATRALTNWDKHYARAKADDYEGLITA